MTIEQKLRQIEAQVHDLPEEAQEAPQERLVDKLTRLLTEEGCQCARCQREGREYISGLTEAQMHTEYSRALMYLLDPDRYPDVRADYEKRHRKVGPKRRE
jgi:hypothetical protein